MDTAEVLVDATSLGTFVYSQPTIDKKRSKIDWSCYISKTSSLATDYGSNNVEAAKLHYLQAGSGDISCSLQPSTWYSVLATTKVTGTQLTFRNAGEIAFCGIKIYGYPDTKSAAAHTRGRGVSIDVDTAGNLFVLNDKGAINKYDGITWTRLPGYAHDFSVKPHDTIHKLYKTSRYENDRKAMTFELNSSTSWSLTTNPALGDRISVGPEYTWISTSTEI